MQGQRAPYRTDAEKVSDCIRYITGDGGFRSFGQFLSALLDAQHADQTVTQTVSHFLGEGSLRPFLDKVAAHRLMKSKGDIQSVVPQYGFRPSDRAGTSPAQNQIDSSSPHGLCCRDS